MSEKENRKREKDPRKNKCDPQCPTPVERALQSSDHNDCEYRRSDKDEESVHLENTLSLFQLVHFSCFPAMFRVFANDQISRLVAFGVEISMHPEVGSASAKRRRFAAPHNDIPGAIEIIPARPDPEFPAREDKLLPEHEIYEVDGVFISGVTTLTVG
ncbi:hypothetical protein [Aliiroseovarius sp. YM-037]|uniref:hypothetical protein n=1 Tax=Aliiroseovarius sp. YM-037 TaxID=3341728 RepID=UPI003A80C14B